MSVPRLSIVDVAPFAAISSSGVRASEGKQRLQRRSDESRRESDDRGEREHKQLRIRVGGRGGSGQSRRAEQHQRQQEALAPEAIPQRGGERGNGRGGEQADEPGDPDRRGAAMLVGEHAESDEVRPLGRDPRPPGELDPSHVLVSNGGTERRDHLACAEHSAPLKRLTLSHTRAAQSRPREQQGFGREARKLRGRVRGGPCAFHQ